MLITESIQADKDRWHIVNSGNRVHLRRAMPIHATVVRKTFQFGFTARTSRGLMRDRSSWFIKLLDDRQPEVFGLGECGPLPGLSPEDIPNLEEAMSLVAGRINHSGMGLPSFSGTPQEQVQAIQAILKDLYSTTFLQQHPSVVFALETAFLDLATGGSRVLFRNEFVAGAPIPINGLIWMGGLDFMLQQVEIKIRDGFRTVKLKVGGLDFERDIDILQYIRRKYFRENIVVRLDANGALKPEEVMYKLNEMARFDVHSIEQPLKTGHPGLAELCRNSPIPVALDEELIGVSPEGRAPLLDQLMPKYLILKPSLHGGLNGCQEWIRLAEERKIGWWITSALESSIGLNAISQFTANYPITLPQGLGTGEIYTNNILSPLKVKAGQLLHGKAENWDLSEFGGPAPQED